MRRFTSRSRPPVGALAALLVGCAARGTPTTDALEKRLPVVGEPVVLENGLRVVVHEDHSAPVVSVAVAYHAGSAADPPGRRGLAHLVEHMMFEGSQHVPRGALDETLGIVGAAHKNATTSSDWTLYYETVPSARLETAMWLESDRMGYPLAAHKQAVLDEVRDVVVAELHERYDHSPSLTARAAVRAALYPLPHPYHFAPIGTLEDLAAITLADVRDFWIRNYGPENATLVLVGDVTPAAGVAMARKWFGPLARGPGRTSKVPYPATVLTNDVTLTIEADTELTEMFLGWPAVPLSDPLAVDAIAYGRQMGWYVAGRLVKDKKLARNASSHADLDLLGGLTLLHVRLEPDTDPQKALQEIQVGLDNLSKSLRYSSDDEVVKDAVIDPFTDEIFALDGAGKRAHQFAVCDVFWGDPRCTPRLLRGFERVSRSSVQESYRRAVLNAHKVVVTVKPTAGAPMGGRVGGEK